MRNTLLTTTALLMSAGIAHADVTFSGKAEVGVSSTAKVKGVAAVLGLQHGYAVSATGALTKTASATAATAVTVTAAIVAVQTAQSAVTLAAQNLANNLIVRDTLAPAAATWAAEHEDHVDFQTALASAQATLAEKKAELAAQKSTATAAVAAGDNVVYTGYDMNVNVGGSSDNGMTFSAAFDMGSGSIADRDDDRVLDAQGGAIALSNVTIGSNGITYVLGQDKQDDLYDDTQNGDLSVSGSMGGIGFTLVTDFDSDTKAVAATADYTLTNVTAARAASQRAIGTTYIKGNTSSTGTYVTTTALTDIIIGDSDAVGTLYESTAAVAAVYQSTSFKLSGDAGALGWSLTSTNKNDRGNAASKVVASYAAGDALSFTLTHDTQGKREAINTLAASFTMDALTVSLKAADDKNHVGNTNTSKKASQNMTIAYANGPWTASFNNDESSQWWSTTKYDLGGGADVFATVDHNEFAVLGMSFSF